MTKRIVSEVMVHMLVDTDEIGGAEDGLNDWFRDNPFVIDWAYVPNSINAFEYDEENYEEVEFDI